MTQKTMVPIGAISINRERFREATGDMEGLAQSILKFGQLQPVVLDDSMELIAGFRRFTAAQMNGQTEIWAVTHGELDELTAREMELEENIRRQQMSWVEEQRAIVEIHRIRTIQNPNWTQPQTAALTDKTQRDVSQATTLVKMMAMFPEIADAKSKSQALSWSKAKASNVERVLSVMENPIKFAAIEDKLALGDSVEYIKTVPSGTIHAVITDPPFGIDYDSRKSGTIGSLTEYKDGEDDYLRLLSMAPDLYRVIKPNGWLVWFLGVSWYERAKTAFREAGFTVDELPIIWDRSEGSTHTNRPDRYFARAYDIALHCFKGDPQIVQRGKPNIIRVKPVDNNSREALVERPVDLYAELIRRLTVSGETVADFFTGSGSCLAAAASLNRDFLGCELSPERRAIAIKKIQAHIPK